MSVLFFTFFLFPNLITAEYHITADSGKPTICQFYLNKEKAERNKDLIVRPPTDSSTDSATVIKSQAQQSRKHKKYYNVKSFYPKEGERGNDVFEKMIKSGTKCDGLIISGHQTGNFIDGKNKLFLEDIENLSCDPKHKEWFANIKSLWLLGCNTVTDEYVKPIREGNTDNMYQTVDSKTTDVTGGDSNERNPTVDIPLMSHAYTATLNEFTPFSSRYLRAFPNTQIYGFEKQAPKDEQMQDSRLVYQHIANLTKALKTEDMTDEKVLIPQAINMLLQGSGFCDEKSGSWAHESGSWAHKDVSSNARSIKNQDYSEAHKLGCNLINAKQILENPTSTTEDIQKAKEQIKATLKTIFKKDKDWMRNNREGGNPHLTYSHLLFNNIYDTWNLAHIKNDSEIKNLLSNDTNFSSILKNRIESPLAGTLHRIDLIQFYKEIGGKPEFIKKQINDMIKQKLEKYLSDQIVTKLSSGNTDRERKKTNELYLSLISIEKLLKYDLLTDEQMESLSKAVNESQISEKQEYHFFPLQVKSLLNFKQEGVQQIVNNFNSTSSTDTKDERIAKTRVITRMLLKSGNIQDLERFAAGIRDNKEQVSWWHFTNEMRNTIFVRYIDQPEKQFRSLLKYQDSETLKKVVPLIARELPGTHDLFCKSPSDLTDSDLTDKEKEMIQTVQNNWDRLQKKPCDNRNDTDSSK